MRQFPQKKLPAKKREKRLGAHIYFLMTQQQTFPARSRVRRGLGFLFPLLTFIFFPLKLPMCQSKGWLWKLGGGGLAREDLIGGAKTAITTTPPFPSPPPPSLNGPPPSSSLVSGGPFQSWLLNEGTEGTLAQFSCTKN